MTDYFHKILYHLYENAELNKNYNISPFLRDLLGGNAGDAASLQDLGTALGLLNGKGFLLVPSMPLLGRTGNGFQYNNLDDHQSINIQLNHSGHEYISKRLYDNQQIDLLRRQTDSIIETNASVASTNSSVQNLNEKVIPYYSEIQRKLGNRTLLLAAISALFLLASVYVANKGVTSSDIESLRQQLQRNTQELDSIRQYQKEIDESLKKEVKDSLHLHLHPVRLP